MSANIESVRRELDDLRAWKFKVLWLLVHASPDAWERGVRQAVTAMRGLPENNLIFFVQRAMPPRLPTPEEHEELRRLLNEVTESLEMRADLLAAAKRNPAWYLRALRKSVASRGAGLI